VNAKVLLLVLLGLLSIPSEAATRNFFYTNCNHLADPNDYNVECPANLREALGGANLGSTSSDISTTTTRTDSPLYWCVIASATQPTKPSHSAIQAGTGSCSTKSGNIASPTLGTNTVNVTGLASATTQWNYWSQPDPNGLQSNISESLSFTTLAGGGSLQGHFVSATGNDSLDGLSDATAWLTTANLSGLASGSDVFFKSTDEWDSRLIIDWPCEISDRCVVGTYWMNGGVETRGLPSGGLPGSPDTAQSTWECATFHSDFPTTYGTGGDKFKGWVSVETRYATIENICVWKADGVGFQVLGTAGAGDAIFENVLGHLIASSGYTANRDLGNNLFNNSVISQASACWGYQLTGCTTGGAWSSSTKHVRSDGSVFSNNIVRESWGEGMGNSSECDGNVIRDNVFYRNRSTNSYANGCSNVVFERNLYLGCGTISEAECSVAGAVKSLWRTIASANTGSAIRLSYENSSYTNGIAATGNIARNNVMINTSTCLSIGAESSAENDLTAYFGIDFIGNTCLAVTSSFWSASDGSSKHVSVYNAPGAVNIKNNIFALRPNAGTNCNDNAAGTTHSTPYIVSDYNQTDEAWDDNGCAGTNDQENTVVDFVTASFPEATSPTSYTLSSACLDVLSDAIGNGPNSLTNLTKDALSSTRTIPFDIGALREACI